MDAGDRHTVPCPGNAAPECVGAVGERRVGYALMIVVPRDHSLFETLIRYAWFPLR